LKLKKIYRKPEFYENICGVWARSLAELENADGFVNLVRVS
jgi:hypothetical protein